jgi:dTMP kinase
VADRLESESLDFHQRVRQTFRALAEAEPDRYLVLDAQQAPEEIAAEIRRRVTELLSGLPLQTLARTRRPADTPATAEIADPAGSTQDAATRPQDAVARQDAATRPQDAVAPHHPHAQTGPTPQLHP